MPASAVTNLAASGVPRPLARSYPVVALKPFTVDVFPVA